MWAWEPILLAYGEPAASHPLDAIGDFDEIMQTQTRIINYISIGISISIIQACQLDMCGLEISPS